MKRLQCLLCGMLLASCLAHAVDMITEDNIWEFSGETVGSGHVMCEIVDAPGKPGLKTLKVTFNKKQNTLDWLDVSYKPLPTEDWRQEEYVDLPYYGTRPESPLWIKIMGDNAPGVNHGVIEYTLPAKGAPVPAVNQWHMLHLPLPTEKLYKNSVNNLSVYMPLMDDKILPVGEDVVFYIGLVKYKPKPRVPWPPKTAKMLENYQMVWNQPVTDDAPWIKVHDGNNQNDHTAVFRNGGIFFDSTADGWNEFAWSDSKRLVLKPETTYRMDFEYEVTRDLSGPNSEFYSLVRCSEAITKDVGWQRWQGGKGSTGRRSVIFTTRDNDDFRVIFGIRDQGAIFIKNIVIKELGK